MRVSKRCHARADATGRRTADLCDTLDVVTKNLAMTLCSALAEAFTALSTSSHVDEM